jgi:hypothetical protein
MKNIVLAPVIVLGCVLLGVIGGALYFGAVIGVLDMMNETARSADNLGRRVSFPAFAFGAPAGAIVGVRIVYASSGDSETASSLVATALSGLVALPCIALPLYASFMLATKVLMSANHTATILGYLSILGIASFAIQSRGLIDACKPRRAS